MKRKQYSHKQKAKILKDAQATSVALAAAKHGVTEASIYNWRKPSGGATRHVGDSRLELRKLHAEASSIQRQVTQLTHKLQTLSDRGRHAAA